MTITLIAAVARNGVIGADGGIPWHLPEDFAHFKATTLGHTLVMGRATYASIGGPLPGRTTIVLTRDTDWRPSRLASSPLGTGADSVLTASSVEEAFALAEGDVYVAGGAAVYGAALPYADEQLISEVDLEPEGDTFYPAYDEAEWPEVSREHHVGFDVVRRIRKPRTTSGDG
jgi:dihydrofolate reductase